MLCAVVLIAAGLAEQQDLGTVFTESEIQYPHLMRRPAIVEGRSWLGLNVVEGGSYSSRTSSPSCASESRTEAPPSLGSVSWSKAGWLQAPSTAVVRAGP